MTAHRSFNHYSCLSPTPVHGLRLRDWLRLASGAGFRVSPSRWPLAVGVTAYSLINELLSALDGCIYGRRVEQTPIEQPPVFIIGHWRTGTTFLHELLAHDDRFAFPSTYECVAPHHFLLSGGTLPRLLRLFTPSRRPMDDMRVGVDLPQEDDIALLALGAPTPMARVVFPNAPPPRVLPFDEELIDGEAADGEDLHRWRQAMLAFVRRLTFAKRKRLLLKSPPHTGRIAQLAELFPGARFIHLLRSPHEVFASTRRLWQALEWAYGLQIAHHRDLDERILTTLERMYGAHLRQRTELPAGSICDVAYERLVADPLAETERIYDQLALGDFAPCRAKLATYVDATRDYRPNRHRLDADLARQIDRRWSGYNRLHEQALEGDSKPSETAVSQSRGRESLACSSGQPVA